MSDSNFIDIQRLDDVVQVDMDERNRIALLGLLKQYTQFLDPNIEDSRRLFPVAYANDPELDSGFQALAQGELIDLKSSYLDTVTTTIANEELTLDEAEAWMIVLNDLRLVLGTQLDISEDEDLMDSDDERMDLYHSLTLLVSLFVESLDAGY